jgi:hypothetical protein
MVSCGGPCIGPGQTCGGGGTANVCGCTPKTSCPAGDNCGTIPNGCGGTVTCGPACPGLLVCGGGGTSNVCGCSGTQPPAPLPVARTSITAATGPDGRIYAIGGLLTSGAFTSEVDAYDACTNAWTAVAPLPIPDAYAAATTGLDGGIYLLGGFGTAPIATAYAYDAAVNSWSLIAPMISARQALAAATGPDGRIYAIGGVGAGNTALSTVEAYNPATNAWTSVVASMSVPRLQHAAVTGPDGRIYAMGGNNYSCGVYNSVEAYSVATNAWTLVAPLPTTPKDKLAASVGPDGRIYAISGSTSGCSQIDTGEVDAYDLTTGTWSLVLGIPTPRESFAAATGPAVAGSYVYAIGGGGFNNPPISSVEALNTATNTW